MYKNRQEKKLNFKRQVYIALVVNLPILRISEGVVFLLFLNYFFTLVKGTFLSSLSFSDQIILPSSKEKFHSPLYVEV